MQVNSVSLNGRVSKTSFGENTLQERLAALNDSEIRQVAYAKTSYEVNDKKHRRIDKAIISAIPLAAGVAAAVAQKSMSRLGRLASFGIGAASWILPFAVVDTVCGAEKLAKKNKSVKEFTKEHPTATIMGTFAASIGAYLALRHGALKGIDKYGNKLLEKASPMLDKLSAKLNKNTVLDKISAKLVKMPSSLKEVSKTALNWAPWALLLTSIAHSFGHDSVKAKNFSQNYNELKAAQELIREDIATNQADIINENM